MFHFHLEVPHITDETEREPVEIEDADDYQYLAIEACSALSEVGCTFVIGGFGKNNWIFDAEYDMSTFVEGLPDLISDLPKGRLVVVDLYSQGVERTLTFHPRGQFVDVACVSRTTWKPMPEVETLSLDDLLMMIRRLAVDFATALTRAAPEIAALEPFPSWRAEVFE